MTEEAEAKRVAALAEAKAKRAAALTAFNERATQEHADLERDRVLRAEVHRKLRFDDWLQAKEPEQVRRMAVSGKLSADEVTRWRRLYDERLTRSRITRHCGSLLTG